MWSHEHRQTTGEVIIQGQFFASSVQWAAQTHDLRKVLGFHRRACPPGVNVLSLRIYHGCVMIRCQRLRGDRRLVCRFTLMTADGVLDDSTSGTSTVELATAPPARSTYPRFADEKWYGAYNQWVKAVKAGFARGDLPSPPLAAIMMDLMATGCP